ncbi:MAG: hypothetical protein K0R38_2927 [Polyangiaceae bacterium]|jgi:hypothetical protein|nr:hypothetical protein [Polyangiaceae bacterium]
MYEEPPRLRLDSSLPAELRFALGDHDDELPSEEELGVVAAGLAAQVGEPTRLNLRDDRDQPGSFKDLALGAFPEPSQAELQALRERLRVSRTGTLRALPADTQRPKGRRALLLAFLLPAAAAAAAGTYWLTRPPEPHAPPSSVPPASSPPHERAEPKTAPASSPSASSSAEPAEAASAPPAPRVVRAAPAPEVSELTLLREAQAALAGNPALSLSLARRHQELHPRGMLSEEREVVAIDALFRLGQTAAARTRAERFTKHYPSSAHWPRLERLLFGNASPRTGASAAPTIDEAR